MFKSLRESFWGNKDLESNQLVCFKLKSEQEPFGSFLSYTEASDEKKGT